MPLAFCLLASLWLNLPFMPSDFARWAMNGTLPTFHCFQKLPRKSAYKQFFKPTVCQPLLSSHDITLHVIRVAGRREEVRRGSADRGSCARDVPAVSSAEWPLLHRAHHHVLSSSKFVASAATDHTFSSHSHAHTHTHTHHRSTDQAGTAAAEPGANRRCADGDPACFDRRAGREDDV